jgi:uncharacterized membrane protein YvbJ
MSFCVTCGESVITGTRICPKCEGTRFSNEKPIIIPIENTKENRVIQAKIATKNEEINNISQTGPVLVFIIGFICCLLIIGIFVGIPLILFAIWWNTTRANEKTKLQNEVKELEAELS